MNHTTITLSYSSLGWSIDNKQPEYPSPRLQRKTDKIFNLFDGMPLKSIQRPSDSKFDIVLKVRNGKGKEYSICADYRFSKDSTAKDRQFGLELYNLILDELKE